jgi:hypothetical protein
LHGALQQSERLDGPPTAPNQEKACDRHRGQTAEQKTKAVQFFEKRIASEDHILNETSQLMPNRVIARRDARNWRKTDAGRGL